MIPMKWIYRSKGSNHKLYKFFKTHYEDLQSTILQEAIFDALWYREQPLIFGYVFMPYMAYFLTTNIYFVECMVQNINRPIGLFDWICGEENSGCFEDAWEPHLRWIFICLLFH